MPIDEANLAEVIDTLKQNDTASAYIAGAMLLLGEIVNGINDGRSPEDETAYINQRMMEGIALLTQARQCEPQYTNKISHIAAMLQTRYELAPEVCRRLADLRPQVEPNSAIAEAMARFGAMQCDRENTSTAAQKPEQLTCPTLELEDKDSERHP